MSFVKSQMMLTASLRVLFSKTERYLLQNQKKFVLNEFHTRNSREVEDKFELQDEFKASDRETEIDVESI